MTVCYPSLEALVSTGHIALNSQSCVRVYFLIMARVWCTILALTLIVAGSGCVENKLESTLGSKINMHIARFGKHQVEIPQSFVLNKAGSSVTFYYGYDADFTMVEFQVVGERVGRDEFAGMIMRRASDIAAEVNEEIDGSMLVANKRIGDDTTLLRYFRNDLSARSHVHEVHRLVDGTQVLLKANSYKGKMEPVEERLQRLAARVFPVEGDSSTSGFCLGPVVIHNNSDYQMGTFHYRDKISGYRDVALEVVLNTMPADDGGPRLLDRLSGNLLGLGLGPRVLKMGETDFSDMSAEEWLGRYSDDKRIEHAFVIESFPEEPSLRTPGLQVNLKTGGSLEVPLPTGCGHTLPLGVIRAGTRSR